MKPEPQKEKHWYRSWWVGSWSWPVGVTLATILWVLLIYFLVGDRSRDWQYGVMPYVPGASALSTESLGAGPAPHQIVLPETQPGGGNERR